MQYYILGVVCKRDAGVIKDENIIHTTKRVKDWKILRRKMRYLGTWGKYYMY